MRILFIHQNFPGQFKHLAPALARAGHEVLALSMQAKEPVLWQGVRVLPYQVRRGSTENIHPWLADFETKVIRGDACFRTCSALKQAGFHPDAVIANHGWGESLFVKEVWPDTRLGIYCEFFYQSHGLDVGFDPEFSRPDDALGCRISLKNANNLFHLLTADAAMSPTAWQASTFPEWFQPKISVIHDGIDTTLLRPDSEAELTLSNGTRLTSSDPVITFVNRNLEPYRGYHVFMRALPAILQKNPRAQVVIVGRDGVSYGTPPNDERTWKQIFIDEIRPQITDAEWKRVQFTGNLAYADFVKLLQVSTTHVYLTYPFVLSWSLLEAMSVGCAIVASRTPPVEEVIVDEKTGILVDFFDSAALADEVTRILTDRSLRDKLGQRAREFAVSHYDLASICLPAQLKWMEGFR